MGRNMFLEAFAAFVDLAACATSEGLSSGNVHVYHGIGAVFGVESLAVAFSYSWSLGLYSEDLTVFLEGRPIVGFRATSLVGSCGSFCDRSDYRVVGSILLTTVPE